MTDIILPELKKITELYKESYGENSNYDLSSYLGHTLQIKKNNLEDIFKILNTKGVIAGGSVVYALNDFVPKTSVGDIDIFINDPKIFKECLGLIKENYPRTKFLRFSGYLSKKNLSVISVEFMEGLPSL